MSCPLDRELGFLDSLFDVGLPEEVELSSTQLGAAFLIPQRKPWCAA
jgi:hypothetical protein